MGIKKVKPTTPGRRQAKFDDFADITKTTPEKNLIVIKKKTGGRNAQGKITVRHIGGGAKRYLRKIDYKRDKFDIPAKVVSIEYDPNRGARIALLCYADGEKRYIIAPNKLDIGTTIVSSQHKVKIDTGNAMPVKFIPAGIAIYNVEMNPGDHPHGGGEGNQSIGLKHPKTPWGKPALGVKTRKRGKFSDKLILNRRKNKKRK